MKKICVFTGAGIDAESGIATFRDVGDGLWYNYNVDEVATVEGWKKDPQKVHEFHNMLRAKLKNVEPNAAHKAIASLDEHFDVTVITQNVSDLQERSGSKKVLHLHGELYKSRSTLDPTLLYDCYEDIKDTDRCEKGSRLRPHTVLFGEFPYNIEESFLALYKCDYLLIIGTSLNIGYTIDMLKSVNSNTKIYYIDPKPSDELKGFYIPIKYIKKKAVLGVTKVVAEIIKDNNEIKQ